MIDIKEVFSSDQVRVLKEFNLSTLEQTVALAQQPRLLKNLAAALEISANELQMLIYAATPAGADILIPKRSNLHFLGHSF